MIIYLDENMPPHLAKGFEIIQKPEGLKTGKAITVAYLPDTFKRGAKDNEWLPVVGKEKSCVITQDLNITRRKDEIELYQKNGVGLFVLKGPNKKMGLSIWEMVQALSKHWPDICDKAINDKRPFAYQFKLTGKMKQI